MLDHGKTEQTATAAVAHNHPGSKRTTRTSNAEVNPELRTPTFIFCDDLRDHPATPTVNSDEIDFFFARQVDVFSRQYKTDLPILESMLVELRERVATLEVQVEDAMPATTTWHGQGERMVFRWYVVSTILDALDAYCWGCPWAQSAHGKYENWRAVRADGALERTWCKARLKALQHLCGQPQHIRNTYHLLTNEKERWDVKMPRLINRVQIKDPPVSLRAFFKLGKELGIPSQLQLEIAVTEKPTGGSFFVW